MLTVFERVPEYFVERYDEEICAWGRSHRKVNYNPAEKTSIHTIALKEGRLSLKPDYPGQLLRHNPEQGAPLKGVRLIAREAEGGRFFVSPLTEEDERVIREHCAKMQRFRWPARLFDKEPPRPGIPFLPDNYGRMH